MCHKRDMFLENHRNCGRFAVWVEIFVMEFQKVAATCVSVVGKLIPTYNFRKRIFLVILELLLECRINEMHLLPLYPKHEMGSEERWNLPSSIVNKARSFPKSKTLVFWKTANQKIWVIRQNKIEQVKNFKFICTLEGFWMPKCLRKAHCDYAILVALQSSATILFQTLSKDYLQIVLALWLVA